MVFLSLILLLITVAPMAFLPLLPQVDAQAPAGEGWLVVPQRDDPRQVVHDQAA